MAHPDRNDEARLDALLRQTLGAPSLPPDQRERHLEDIRRIARGRNRGGTRVGLAEMAVVAAFALIALTGAVVWQSVLTENDSPGATAGSLYALRNLTIVEIDPESGEIRREIDQVRGATNCTFLIASPNGDLLAAGDIVGPDDQVGISVYKTSDGSLQQEIPVPNILQPLGRCWSVTFSADGQRIFAFQYEIPDGGTGDDARYWLGTYDLDDQTWLPEIEIPGCRGGLMQATTVDRLYILCSLTYEIDPETGEILQTFGAGIQEAAFLVRDRVLYDVAITQAVLVQHLDVDSESGLLLRGAQLDVSERRVAGLPVGLDASARYLFVPVRPTADYFVPESEISVIDLERDEVARVITPSRPFHDIAYTADGETAFIVTTDEVGRRTGLTRIDLKSGEEFQLLTGDIGNLVYVAGD